MAFHNGSMAEPVTGMQLCSVRFGHKCLVTNGKQVVNVVVKKKSLKKDCVLCLSSMQNLTRLIQKERVTVLLNFDIS